MSNQQQLSAVDIAPASAIKKKGGENALPKSSEVGAESRNLEVVAFWVCKDGIGVKLGNEDMEG